MAKKEYPASLRLSKQSKLIPRDISESLGKLPPQAPEIETAILGAIMIEQPALDQVINLLKAEHFYEERHKLIYEAIVTLKTEGSPTDMRYVVRQLRKTGHIELVGGAFYISDLTSKVASAANIQHDALIVIEMAIKRGLIALASQIHHDAYEDTQDVFELLKKCNEDLQFLEKNSIPKNNEAYIKDLWEQTLVLNAPEEEPPLITINDTAIAIPGNHTLIVGKKKTRKTLFIVWLVAQYIKANESNAGKVMIFDTEQGRSHVYKIREKIYRMTGMWIPVFTLRGKTPEERKDHISLTLAHWTSKPKLIVIDGIRDCMVNINDPVESTDLMVWLEQLTTTYNVGILEVLHLNKTDNNARGHIGTELLNKALCTIEMEIDKKNGCTIVKCESARDVEFESFAFTHDNDYLPSVVGTPMKGEIVAPDEKWTRVNSIFEDVATLGYAELIKRAKEEFQLGETRVKKVIRGMIDNGEIIKNGSLHSPNTVYKLGAMFQPDANGHRKNGNATAQIKLNLESTIKTQEAKVEEVVVAEEVDTSDLPF